MFTGVLLSAKLKELIVCNRPSLNHREYLDCVSIIHRIDGGDVVCDRLQEWYQPKVTHTPHLSSPVGLG